MPSIARASAVLPAIALMAWLSVTPARATEFGVYDGGGCNGATALQTYLSWAGHAPDRVLDFGAFDSWHNFTENSGWVIWCWNTHGHPALTLTVPLTVVGTALTEIAAGRFDDMFARLGRTLVNNNYRNAIIRLGAEMNANWFPWGNLGDHDPATQAQRIAVYKAAFAHVVHVLRAVDGGHFLIDWCPAGGYQQVAPTELYPGDDVVDIVGTDVYAVAWGVDHPDAARVEAGFSQGWQLDAVAAFGRQHGKPISFPEWGVGDRPQGHANYGPGDSPEVMTYLIRWFAAHAARSGQPPKPGEIAYLDYWDYNAGDYNSKVSNGQRPNQGAVLKAAISDGLLSGRLIRN